MSRRRAVLRRFLAPLCAVAAAGCIEESMIKQPELDVVPGPPPGWQAGLSSIGIGTTSTDTHGGATAAYLSSAFQLGFGSYTMVQYLRADDYRGKRMRLSAWLKPRNITNVSTSGIWMRVDANTTITAYDNMSDRVVRGFGDWRQVSVVLDVGQSAVGIVIGGVFQGSNTLLIDDFKFEEVGSDVASTNTLAQPISSGLDSAGTAALYDRANRIPGNMDFEGFAPVSSETSNWIRQNASEIASSSPTNSLDDLEPLRAMVGSAHFVGLGDATYGTRESLQLKHRLVRFLVTRMGFTTVALEASAAEADDINQYVQTGTGDPAKLLSRLYFWGWNAREVDELIAWMKEWNASAPAAQRVQFRGLDMQYPGASIDSVVSFLTRAKPDLANDVKDRYRCMEAYRNHGAAAGRSRLEYGQQPTEQRRQCAEEIADATLMVSTNGVGVSGLQAALQHARIVQQFENIAATTSTATMNRRRDSSMAENVTWLRDQAGTNSRVVILSHNDRVTRQANAMGAALAARYGDDYRPVGVSFGTGNFNAGLQQGSSVGAVQSMTSQKVPARTIEEAFLSATSPLLLFDARRINTGGAAAASLKGPIGSRTIGLGFDPSIEASYFTRRLLPDDYDLLLFVRAATASTLLPFN